jgi:beta-1,4-N-acetylglucosaminyltransferase
MILQAVTVLILLLVTRICVVLSNPSPKPRKRNDGETCVLAVFLGSGFSDNPLIGPAFSPAYVNPGGHTSEALMLTSGLDFSRYSPRIYIVSEGDTLSTNKVVSLEHSKAFRSSPIPVSSYHPFRLVSTSSWCFQASGRQKDYKIVTVPRARRVHQATWTVLLTCMRSVLACIYLVTIAPLLKKDPFGTPFADLLIMNGPGTCVTLCAAVMVNKVSSALHTPSEYPLMPATFWPSCLACHFRK